MKAFKIIRPITIKKRTSSGLITIPAEWLRAIRLKGYLTNKVQLDIRDDRIILRAIPDDERSAGQAALTG